MNGQEICSTIPVKRIKVKVDNVYANYPFFLLLQFGVILCRNPTPLFDPFCPTLQKDTFSLNPFPTPKPSALTSTKQKAKRTN